MLINSNAFYTENVEFVSYTGSYPNLCSGVLTLKIDKKEVKFGHESKDFDWKTGKYKDDNYSSFWNSGGGLDNDYCAFQGEWLIDVSKLPEQYRKYARQIDEIFNEFVPFGCCGGCS